MVGFVYRSAIVVLSEEQIQHFFREGYVLAPGLVPLDVVDEVVAIAKDKIVGHNRWQPTCFEHETPQKDANIHRLLIEPNVVQAVSQLLGTEPRAYFGMLAIVPPHGGSGLPWHQDNMYDQILGGALNTFIALCDITPNKAILWVSPQSHRLGTQPSGENQSSAPGHREVLIEPANGIPLPAMKPGDACIFDRNTLHRSLKNETDEPRYAYAAQYQSEHARRSLTGERDPKKMRVRDLEKLMAPVLGRAMAGRA